MTCSQLSKGRTTLRWQHCSSWVILLVSQIFYLQHIVLPRQRYFLGLTHPGISFYLPLSARLILTVISVKYQKQLLHGKPHSRTEASPSSQTGLRTRQLMRISSRRGGRLRWLVRRALGVRSMVMGVQQKRRRRVRRSRCCHCQHILGVCIKNARQNPRVCIVELLDWIS